MNTVEVSADCSIDLGTLPMLIGASSNISGMSMRKKLLSWIDDDVSSACDDVTQDSWAGLHLCQL